MCADMCGGVQLVVYVYAHGMVIIENGKVRLYVITASRGHSWYICFDEVLLGHSLFSRKV